MDATPQIICYSRTGHSRRLADQLVDMLGGAVQDVTTPHYRWPVLGWLAAGRDGLRGHASPLHKMPELSETNGLVVLVGPVWAGQPAAPLNTVVDHLKGGPNRVAAALTCADLKEDTKPLDALARRLGRPLVAQMMLSNKIAEAGQMLSHLTTFVQTCKTGEEWQG